MSYGIKVKSIYCEDKVLKDATIIVENNIIKDIVKNELVLDYSKGLEIIDFSNYSIIAGLVDLHIHGGNGYDTMDANFNSLNEISKYLAKRGVTSFLPTTVTDEMEKLKKAVVAVAENIGKVEGAEIVGSYVEGPYITKENKGAHPEHLIRTLRIDEIRELIELSKDTIKVLTIAPEKQNSKECIEYLVQRDVRVSMGHTNANYDEVVKAVRGGANISVHTFNGMRGFNHREPGVVGAVLTEDSVYCELICDLVHVHPAAIDLLLRCKNKDKVILMSDSMQAAGLEDGDYMLGALKVIVKDSIARVESGSLAGSTTNVLAAIKNMIDKIGVNPIEAINMGSLNPSKLLGIDDTIGSIKIGKRANFVIVDDEFNVINTVVAGGVLS